MRRRRRLAAAAGRGTFPGQPHHRRLLGQPLPPARRGRDARPIQPPTPPAPPHAGRREQVVRLRREHRIGPLRLAARTSIAASTAHRILNRYGLPALAACDRATGVPVRRYERSRPCELVHIDVKNLGRIPDGGGHRTQGRAEGRRNRTGTGYAYLHTALDDHTRLAYTEDLPDETAATCAAFLIRAAAWFATHGITIERVMTDNTWAYTKNTWRQTCHDLDISPRRTRPWRPQTNGKVERFHRTLLEEWAYQQPYTSDTERQAAFPDWLDWYNYHPPHTGIDGHRAATELPCPRVS